MTDEQLQSLFASMERHLDKRADAIEQRVAAVEERVTAMETKLEKVATTLLAEFHKWASPVDARARTHSAALRAIDLEMEALTDACRNWKAAQAKASVPLDLRSGNGLGEQSPGAPQQYFI